MNAHDNRFYRELPQRRSFAERGGVLLILFIAMVALIAAGLIVAVS